MDNDNEKNGESSNESQTCLKNIFNIKNKISKSKYFSILYYRNNLTLIIFLLIYLLISAGLVVIQVYIYRDDNLEIKVARSCGILISFNMAFIILLVLRRPNTWLRSRKFARYCLPFDDFIQIHKAIGFIILFLSFVHTIAHSLNLCNIFSLLNLNLNLY
jgi:DMSO reductase anchor subunit